MNYFKVLCALDDFFTREGVRYAVVGAFALHAYGLTRATADLDLVSESQGQSRTLAFLEGLGYEALHVSPGYSNHVHPLGALGRVDFVYVGGTTADELFAAARKLLVLQGRTFPVPCPEHLAAMKAFAVKNAPERALRDLADVEFLLGLPEVKRDEVRASFERYGLGERFREIEEGVKGRGS
ncbi:MAG: hypothetical protein AB1578_13865 [Thermodesulfobacteriota bacterium]